MTEGAAKKGTDKGQLLHAEDERTLFLSDLETVDTIHPFSILLG